MKDFFKELKRRNIYKVGVVYGITGWLIVQMASIATDTFAAPPWVMKIIITAILLGFPLTLIITWAFEVTPEGVKRTETADQQKRSSEKTSGDQYFWMGTVLITILLVGGWWFMMEEAGPSSKEKTEPQINERSIAVLPFTNLGGSGKADPLAKGIHDDLLTRLSNISDLQVISRTSVEQYRDTEASIPAIADSLNVRWIVEGGVLEMGDKVQVNAQLIDPRNDSHIWARDYQRKLTAENFFAIQGEITNSIARALEAELSINEQERIVGSPTEDMKAYRFYVKGRNLLDKRTASSVRQAKHYFQKALRTDSSYALAWSGLADAYCLSPFMIDDMSPTTINDSLSNSFTIIKDSLSTALPEAEKAAREAIQLDPELAEAHASMGLVHFLNQNGPSAHRELQRSIELKPSYYQGHHWFAALEKLRGHPESALKHYRLSVELNPQNQSVWDEFIGSLIATGNYNEALQQARKQDFPGFQATALLHLKQTDHVRKLVRQHTSKAEDLPEWTVISISLADIIEGDTVSAQKRLNSLNRDDISYLNRLLLQAALGNIDEAFSTLNEINLIGSAVSYIRFNSIRYIYPDLLANFRAHPKYDELIKDINKQWGFNSTKDKN